MEERRKATGSVITALIFITVAVTAICFVVFILGNGLEKITNFRDENSMDSTEFSARVSDVVAKGKIVTDEIVGTEASVEVVSSGSIEDIVAISELQTLTYVYDDIYTKYVDEQPLFYVYYEGTVTLGIRSEDIVFDYGDDTNKVITVTVPRVQVLATYVDAGSLDFIIDSKDDTSENTNCAYALCQVDLEQKVAKDTIMMELAKESTMAEVKALTEPLVEQFYPDYEIEFVWEE